MITKTKGVILHSLKYGETSIIAKVFTREHGLQSYIIPGVRKQKSKIKQNLFQPLSVVDLVAYHKDREGLHHIKEIRCPRAYETIPYDVSKSSVAIFLAEVLNHALKRQEANPAFFDFLEDALHFLDREKGSMAHFHIVFLLRLSRYLGIEPRANHSEKDRFFNIREGVFSNTFENSEYCLDQEISRLFSEAITTELKEHKHIRTTKADRKILLLKTIDYYRYHLEGMPEMKSFAVLEMVLGA